VSPSRRKTGWWFGVTSVAVVLTAISTALLLSRPRDQALLQGGGSGDSPGPAGSPSPSLGASDLSAAIGTWEFVARTGVPLPLLPPSAVRGPEADLVIHADGSFQWGGWTGFVRFEGSEGEFALFLTHPANLRRRFKEYNAGVGVSIAGRKMQIIFPDLGQDRDIDYGQAQEDIDSNVMLFRRVRS
jgi:hypothetical protein